MSQRTRSAALVLVLITVSVVSFAQSPSAALPDTVPGKLLGEWIAFCNAPNPEAWAKWNAAHYDETFLKENKTK